MAKRSKNRNRKNRKSTQQSRASDAKEKNQPERRHGMLGEVSGNALTVWHEARMAGESDPVIIVLDMEDGTARDVARGIGMTDEAIAAHRAHYRGAAIPAVVTNFRREWAIEVSKRTTAQGRAAAALASGPVPGTVDVLIVAGGGNTLARLPTSTEANGRSFGRASFGIGGPTNWMN